MKSHIYILFMLLALTSCKKKVDCAAFDGTLLYSWFPYKEGETYYYSNSDGDRDTMIIADVSETGPHKIEYETGLNSKHKFCDIRGVITSQKDKNRAGLLSMFVQHVVEGNDGTGNSIQFSFKSAYLVTFGANGTDMGELVNQGTPSFEMERLPILTVNGKDFTDVLVISVTRDMIAESGKLDKIYIAKGHGFIGYRSYPDKKEFWIQ